MTSPHTVAGPGPDCRPKRCWHPCFNFDCKLLAQRENTEGVFHGELVGEHVVSCTCPMRPVRECRGWLRRIGVTDPLAALDAVRQIGGKVSDNAPSVAQVGDKTNPDTQAAANADKEGEPVDIAYADVRPEVKAFAVLMERELRENGHKGNWKYCGLDHLRLQFVEEFNEARYAIEDYQNLGPQLGADVVAGVASECSDLANYCMMICDVLGVLPLSEKPDSPDCNTCPHRYAQEDRWQTLDDAACGMECKPRVWHLHGADNMRYDPDLVKAFGNVMRPDDGERGAKGVRE